MIGALSTALPPGALAPQRFDTSVFCDFDEFHRLCPDLRAQIVVGPNDLHSLGRHPAITGHFALSTLLCVSDAPRIATVLREPRARLLSLYMYWRTPGISDRWSPYTANESALQPLAEFLSDCRVAAMVDNQVCRMLLHPDPRIPIDGHIAADDIQSIALDALRRLRDLGFVGVLELEQDAWRGIAEIFDVQLESIETNITGEHAMPTPARPDEHLVSAHAIDPLAKRTEADMLVYDFALASYGLHSSERQRIREEAFAKELVKLGDLLGGSARRLEDADASLASLRSDLSAREALLLEHERTIDALREEAQHRDYELRNTREWLAKVHSSPSWRLTAPLRHAKHTLSPIWRTHDLRRRTKIR